MSGLRTAFLPFVYEVSRYGPVPSTPGAVRRPCCGYFWLSTIEPAPVAALNGKVASGEDRWKVTVRPSALTERSVPNREDGPTSDLIALTRSKEYLTSSAVIARPLGKVSPARNRQR